MLLLRNIFIILNTSSDNQSLAPITYLIDQTLSNYHFSASFLASFSRLYAVTAYSSVNHLFVLMLMLQAEESSSSIDA